MINKRVLVIIAAFVLGTSHVCHAELPVCSNRVINEVSKRVGCAIGDSKCWLSKGGMCTDYIQNMTNTVHLNKQIRPGEVRKGDVAQFISRAHYAYVERVIKDRHGKPVAVNVSEYNYGTCWVDQSMMVTDQYKKVNKRSDIPLSSVDGGFWRPR